MAVKIRGLLDTKCLFTVAISSFSVHVEDLPRSAAIFSQVVPIRTNFAKNWARSEIRTKFLKFEEARRNPDKNMKPLSGRKCPFRDQASPTIARGPAKVQILP